MKSYEEYEKKPITAESNSVAANMKFILLIEYYGKCQ